MRETTFFVLACVAALACMASAPLAAQPRGPAPHETLEVLDALVYEGRLVTLERARCTAAQPFEAPECAVLVAREPASWAEVFRTPVPLRIRGVLQLDVVSRGLMLRAHDRGALFDSGGRATAAFAVPASSWEDVVWLSEANGAVVLHRRSGCSAYVLGLSQPSVGHWVLGVESHLYGPEGGPHDTYCLGFTVRPVGEIRTGTRPAPRGRRGELRHALASTVVVTVAEISQPVVERGPAVLGLAAGGVQFRLAVGPSGNAVQDTGLLGSACWASSQGEHATTRVDFDCATGRVVPTPSTPEAGTASPDAGVPLPARHDRRGLPIPVFARCVVEQSGPTRRVLFDGREVLVTSRDVLVLDQRGERCLAVEVADPDHPTDLLHRLELAPSR